jgi:DNA-binding NarL/FixJ family response regulator
MIFIKHKPTAPHRSEYETWHQIKLRQIQERTDAILRCKSWGLSQSKTARFLGITANTLRSHLRNNRVPWSEGFCE